MKHLLLSGFISGILLGLMSCQPAAPSKPPNILFIMADDHTSQAFGLYGSRLDSIAPVDHIRRLAAEGMTVQNLFCTNSICVPSRAAILTGQYSHRNGVYTLSDPLDTGRVHVGHLLQQAGYQTSIVGKWHLKTEPQGFDYYHVLPGQGLYHNPKLKEKGQPWEDGWGGGEVIEGYSTDVITDQALGWLEGRKEEDPFFLMCHFKATHEPFDYAPRYQEAFRDQRFPLPPSILEDLTHRSPATQSQGMFLRDLYQRYTQRADRYPSPPLDTTGLDETDKILATYQKFIGDYLRSVAGINDNLGRILDYLEANELADNTIVVYTSDQGYFLGEHGYIDKRMIYEESARMPMVIRYPPSIEAGSRNEDLLLNVDFAPTFLEIAGFSAPDSMQGSSFWANVQGNTPTDWRESLYYRYWMQERRPAHYGIRSKDHKLIFFYSHRLGLNGSDQSSAPGWELYDLKADPLEQQNVYGQAGYEGITAELLQNMDAWKAQLGDTDEAYPIVQELRAKTLDD
ncbi:MAG: sulfatase [Bacteroidota bacterium]